MNLKKVKIMPVKLGILLNLHYQLLQIVDLTNSLRINNAITEDPKIIVNEFNNFFCSIGSNLAEKIKKNK